MMLFFKSLTPRTPSACGYKFRILWSCDSPSNVMPDVLCCSVRSATACVRLYRTLHHLIDCCPSKTDYALGFEQRSDVCVLCFKRTSLVTMLRADWKWQCGSRNQLWDYSREQVMIAGTSMAARKGSQQKLYSGYVLKSKANRIS